MQIWIDADACPVAIKEMLFKVAIRKKIMVTLVANQAMRFKPSPFIRLLQVPSGFDEADKAIVERCEAGDLIITADIPLAAEVVAKSGLVITPRGEELNKTNIKGRLAMRDFMDTLRYNLIT